MNFTEKLELTKYCHQEMKLIIDTCKGFDDNVVNPWHTFWDHYWEVSAKIPFEIEWLRLFGTDEEDMNVRFSAVNEFVEQLSDNGGD